MTKAKGGYKIKENGKKDTGRPTVMTPETLTKLEQAYSIDSTDEEACIFAGIGLSTLYSYQNENPKFIERKRLLKEKLALKARTVIADALNNNDESTAKWYLERKKKDEFSTKSELGGVLAIHQEVKPDLEAIKELKGLLENDE